MAMSKLKILPLVCPDCGRTLFGLRYDKVFMCMQCLLGLAPAEQGWKRYKLEFPVLDETPADPPLYLPMWKMKVDVKADPQNKFQKASLRILEDLDHVWATGFSIIRPSYYADPGLAYTEQKVDPEAYDGIPPRAFVAGCTRGTEEADRYAELYVTLMLDKRADVTGMEINVTPLSYSLWAMPFTEREGKVRDMFAGLEIPVFALDDYLDIKRIRERL
ncbi:MAG: hypothetical protein R6V10_15195 [bacterium]